MMFERLQESVQTFRERVRVNASGEGEAVREVPVTGQHDVTGIGDSCRCLGSQDNRRAHLGCGLGPA